MLSYRKRVLLEFDYLKTQEDYVSAKQIADHINVSEKTVKNDMRELSELCLENGAKLVSRKSHGYHIDVFDRSKYDKFYDTIQLYFHYSGVNHSKIDDDRLFAILQAIVMAEDYLSVDDLAEMFYVTRASINKHMKRIQSIIESYNLRIKKKSEEGPMIKGEEYDLRSMIMDSIENFHYMNKLYFFEDIYEKFFLLDSDEERLGLRQIFLKTLRQNNIHIRDDMVNKISLYLCLIKRRFQSGKVVHFSEEKRDVIESIGFYKVFKKMFDELNKFTDYPENDNEIAGFTLYLTSHLDGPMPNDCFPQKFIDEAADIADNVIREIKEIINLDFDKLKGARKRMVDAFVPIVLQSDFGFASHKYVYELDSDKNINPLASYLSHIAESVFERIKKKELSKVNAILIGFLFSDLISMTNYPFEKLNIAIVSLFSLDNGKTIKRIFLTRFKNYIDTIEHFELYELRAFPEERFDVVVANFSGSSNAYRYVWPLFSFKNIPTDKDLNKFYNHFILSQLHIDELILKYDIPKARYYNDIHCEDLNMFSQMLSVMYHTRCSDNNMKKYMCKPIVINGTAYYFLPKKYIDTSHNRLDIFYFSNQSQNKTNLKRAIVITIDLQDDFLKSRMIHDLFATSVYNPSEFDKLVNKQGDSFVEDSIKESLKVFPFTSY